MNIAELKGEKTVKALVKRLLEQTASSSPSAKGKRAPSTTESELEAALLRANPHLSQIGNLEKGTPILVPGEFPLKAAESADPRRRGGGIGGNADDAWLRHAETALGGLRAVLGESVAQAGEQSERVQTWLKGDGAKEVLQRAPELKEAFRDTAAAAKALRDEQAALVTAQEGALGQVRSELASFLGVPPP